MAPEPSSHEQPATRGGPLITGHKISLNVHYDAEDVTDDATSVKFRGQVTPIEEKISSAGAFPLSSKSDFGTIEKTHALPTIGDVRPSTINGEKITHVDNLIETNHEPVDGSLRSVSSLCEVRSESPDTSPIHSDPESEELSSVRVEKEERESLVAAKTHYVRKEQFLNGPDQIIPSDRLKVWGYDDAIKLQMGDKGPAAHTPVSVPTMLRRVAEKYPSHKALAVKRNNMWQHWTYAEYYASVRIVAKALIKLGLERFHGVGILGFNSPEWFFSNIGAIFAGGMSAGIYTTNTPESCEHCLANCQAQIVLVEDQKQLDKIIEIRPNLPHLKVIVQWAGKPTTEGVLSWTQLMDIGRNESDAELNLRLKQLAVNQCCTLIYTSGTTGAPKGVMLSQDNLSWTAHANAININPDVGNEVVVSFLPLSHVAAQVCDIYLTIDMAATVYFAKPDALKGSLGETLKEIRPTKFLGVPRVWEKIHEKMLDVGRKNTGIKKSIAPWAKALGLESNIRKQDQDFSKPFLFSVANAIVFKKVKEVLGLDRCNMFISAAAPISLEVIQYFHSLDICVTEIYGMSESSGPHTVGVEQNFKYGSAGRTVDGCLTKLANPDADGNGEICMGGRNVCMGYLLMEDKTHEAIDDEGWLHSGDIGRIDKDDHLFITGRLKELIITAGGENIPPVLIEDGLKSELPCLSNAMVIGDRKKFLSVLLTLKTNVDSETRPLDTLTPACIEWCRLQGSSASTVQDVIGGPDAHVMSAIQDGIDRANAKAASNAQKVQKWTILPIDFSVPGDELGPTLKLKRPVVVKKYADTIERFYL